MNKKVLLIEDDSLTRRMYEVQFKHTDYELIMAEDGPSGLDKIFSERPDCVLLDLMLPGMDGVTLLKEMRKKEKEEKMKQTPVIVLTNLGDEKVSKECSKYGIAEYILKVKSEPLEIVKKVKKVIKT